MYQIQVTFFYLTFDILTGLSHPKYFYRNKLHLQSLPVLLNYMLPETVERLCCLVGKEAIVKGKH